MCISSVFLGRSEYGALRCKSSADTKFKKAEFQEIITVALL
jgi:hypothetical protein